MTDVEPQSPAALPGEIVATAGRYYRNARYLMAAVCLACAAWFAYDGWVAWPAQNDEFDRIVADGRKPERTKHSDTDLATQRALACGLPVLAVCIVGWLLYNSRGRIRLADDVLYAPGHPPVPVDAIREIDKTKWDKKGIVYLDYELDAPTGGKPTKGSVVLDDFVYQADPIHAILKAIEAKVVPESAPASDLPEEPTQA